MVIDTSTSTNEQRWVSDVRQLSDGHIVAVEVRVVTPAPVAAPKVRLVRYLDSGQLDPAYGTNGRSMEFPGISSFVGQNFTIGSDGTANSTFVDPATGTLKMVRFTAAGALDSAFDGDGDPDGDGDGVVSTNAPIVQPWALVQGANGGFLQIGSIDTGESRVIRLLAGGVIDGSFNDSDAFAGVQLDDIRQLSNGMAVVGGAAERDVVVARVTATGSIDPTFGNAGRSRIDLGGDEHVEAIDVDSAGRILVTGASVTDHTTSFVLRLLPDGALDASFGQSGVVRAAL